MGAISARPLAPDPRNIRISPSLSPMSIALHAAATEQAWHIHRDGLLISRVEKPVWWAASGTSAGPMARTLVSKTSGRDPTGLRVIPE